MDKWVRAEREESKEVTEGEKRIEEVLRSLLGHWQGQNQVGKGRPAYCRADTL